MKESLKEIFEFFKKTNPELLEVVNDVKITIIGVIDKTLNVLRKEIETQFKTAIEDIPHSKLSELWHQVKRIPFSREMLINVSDDVSVIVQRSLLSVISRSSINKSRTVLDSLTNTVLHIRDLEESKRKSSKEIMNDITNRICALNDVARDSWDPYVKILIPIYHQSRINHILVSNALPRLLLPGVAAVLHGHDPRHDEFITSLIIAFSAGSIAQDTAINMASFFERIIVSDDTDILIREKRMNNIVDSLLAASQDCKELGDNVWIFFDTVQRDLRVPVPLLSIEKWGWHERLNMMGLTVAAEGKERVFRHAFGGLIFITFIISIMLFKVTKVVSKLVKQKSVCP